MRREPAFGPSSSPAGAPLPRLVVARAPAASDCPDAAALAAEVARRMGRPALDPIGIEGMPGLDVRFERQGDAYAAVVVVRGRERRLADPGPGCAGLADALALTLAILLDRDAPPPLPPPPPLRPLPPSVPPPAPRPPEAAPREPRLGVALEGAFTYGLLGAAARPELAALAELRIRERLPFRSPSSGRGT
jgi:hypothetical protein